MPDVPLDQLVARLANFPQLGQSVSLTQLQAFLSLISRLLPAIRSDPVNAGLTLPSHLTLPVPVVDFLATSLQLPTSIVILCWAGFGDWAGEPTTSINEDELLGSLGTHFGIGRYGHAIAIRGSHVISLQQATLWSLPPIAQRTPAITHL